MALELIITAILAFVIIYLLYIQANNNFDYWSKLGVTQWKTRPFLGSILNVALGRETLSDLACDIYENNPDEKYVGYYIFKEPVLLIRDIELINQIMIKDFSYFQDRNAINDDYSDLNNAGLQNINGERWKVLRHKLTPTFTSGKMKAMFKNIKECSNEVVDYLRQKNGEDIPIRTLSFKFVLNLIGNIAFGLKIDALNDKTVKENQFYQYSKEFFKPTLLFQLKLILSMNFPKIKDLLGLKLVDNKVNDFFQKLTQDLIDYREKNGEKRNDFLQLMLQHKHREQELLLNNIDKIDQSGNDLTEAIKNAEEPEDIELLEHLKNIKYDKNSAVFTDQIIAGNTFVFISGGSETVALVLSFCFYELAVNQDIQAKLHDEIDTVLQSNDFTYEAIKKMTYLEQILNETIRLKSPGQFLTRVCTEDYKLPGTDLVIKKDQTVTIPVLGIHRDPQYFPEPLKFNPDRFHNMDAIPKGVFFPFGAGPRLCIAMRLAMLEMKVFVATVFASYRVVLSDKTQTPLRFNKRSILQHVIGGLWVKFEPRK